MIAYLQLFTRLGSCVYWSDQLLAQQNTIYLADPTGMAEDLASIYAGRLDLIPNSTTIIQGFASTMASQINTPVQYANNTLGDLQAALQAPSAQPQTILPLLYADMVSNGQTVQSNVIATPIVAAAGSNIGNGILRFGTMNVLGITDERIINEVVSFRCTNSLYSRGAAGSERFSVCGSPSLPSPTFYGPLGTGNPTNLTVADSKTLLNNGNFETWTVANTPDNWTIIHGVPGTTILENIYNQHNGSACLELAGNGVATQIELNQIIAPAVGSNTIYAAGIWIRKMGTVTSGSTLAVTIKGAGAATQTICSIDPSTLTTSYQLYTVFWATSTTVGNSVPPDYQIDINWTSANAAGAAAVILIDDAVLVRPLNYGYVSYAIFEGSIPFAVGDTITSTTAVTISGTFQSWFARFEQFSLPSSLTPTISDALANSQPT